MLGSAMVVAQVEGRLEDLQQIVAVPGVAHVSPGVKPVGGERYRTVARIDQTAIPLLEALGLIVTVIVTQEQLDSPSEPEE
jgi:hypothetical protein